MHYIDYNERFLYYRYKNKIYRYFINKKIDKHNKKYINNEIKKEFIVNNIELDKYQKEAIFSDEINNLVIAGAGSGKSLTIVGKINYLINRGIKENEILCISFTNDACNSLKDKLNNNVEVLTFHKLALKYIKYNKIVDENYLNYIINEYFNSYLYNNNELIINLLKYCNYQNNDYNEFIKSKEFNKLKNDIKSFIHLFKANGYKYNDFLRFNGPYKLIIRIIVDIYYLYQEELKSQNNIDFDDMIINATENIKNNNVKLRYKYIIIDEFQDTSMLKYQLIKEIINKTKAKTFFVGDDYQSIYKFTGCNLDLFTNFNKFFGYTKTIIIKNTYRNSKQLIDVSTKFIMKNKSQIKKNMISLKDRSKPIKIVKETSNILDLLIEYLYNKKERNILILGRNNNDIFKYMNDNYKYEDNKIIYKNLDMNIYYLTAHCSKGLESDCVILLNLYDDILGFPCKIKNSNIIDLLLPKDNYLYEEERRLFYVCLTRTKKDIYLICPINLSLFVKEIIKDNKKNIEYISL